MGQVARGRIAGKAWRPVLVRAVGLAGLATGSAQSAENPASLLLFGSLEASPSVFVTTGVKFAADRVDREGFVALASLGGGRRTETAAIRSTALGAAVFGYQWFRDWGVVTAYAGPEGALEILSNGGGMVVLPARIGLRLHGEVWARPSDATLLTATVILGSSRSSAWTRLSWGLQAWGAYVGPEASFYLDASGYRKWSVGLHATDFALGRFTLRVSAGYQIASEAGAASPYVGLAAWTPW